MKRLYCVIAAVLLLLTGCAENSREIHNSNEPHFTIASVNSDIISSSSLLENNSTVSENNSKFSQSTHKPDNSTVNSTSSAGEPQTSQNNSQSSIQITTSVPQSTDQPGSKEDEKPMERSKYSLKTRISEVTNDPIFGEYGRLIFPVDGGYYSGETLEELRLTWYNNIDPNKTVEIANYFADHAASKEQIFYNIYTDAEKAADPDKRDTGLFFFRGNKNAPFAVCNAGGGFAYVGAMHDSFPHALELSKRGYNAFALIYRPGAQTACEDLARAITFIFENAEELGVSTKNYSLWGGSAGARMAAYLGTYGTAYFGGDDLPKPGAVIMQYTGHSEYSENDPPTFVCVGDSDGIANWRTMESRINALKSCGIPTEFHVYSGLRHGFGIGTGTVAEGWLDQAVKFWENQM